MSSLLSAPTPVRAVLEHQHGLLEGPRFAGVDVFYSDVTNGGVWRATPEGSVEPVIERRRGIGGIALHVDGGLIVGGRTLLHHQPAGEARELVAGVDTVTGFNDLHVLPDGSVLAGALRFKPMAGEPPAPGLLIRVGGVDANDVVDDALLWPNGIGHSPAGDQLYVSDYAARNVITMASDGSAREVFAEVPHGSADGLAVDVEGGVWVALGEGGAIARFTASGDLDGIVDVPAGFVSSLSFGGPDGCDVLITTADNAITPETGGTLWRARSAIAGVPAERATV